MEMKMYGAEPEEKLREQLKIAAKKIKDNPGKYVPVEGCLTSVIYGDPYEEGDHWQVDLVYDLRFSRKPWIAAYVWVNDKCPKCDSKHGAWHGQGTTRYHMAAYMNGKIQPKTYREDRER